MDMVKEDDALNDVTLDQTVDKVEAKLFYTHHNPTKTDADFDAWFAKLDTNGDGVVDAAEVEASLPTNWNAEIKKVDSNGNGVIDHGEEWRQFYANQFGTFVSDNHSASLFTLLTSGGVPQITATQLEKFDYWNDLLAKQGVVYAGSSATM